jgi:putative addiction module component (TIGR02574 family)
MSIQQLKAEALALPISERVSLAQTLWESIESDLPEADEDSVLNEAIRRDGEMASGAVKGRPHGEVIAATAR